jgi:5-methylcytosine-specific restriction endonuclease McrA
MRNPITQIKKFMAQAHEPPRSDKWPAARRAHLKIEGWCRYCGGVKNLEVHHIMPFHDDPARELDPANFITLCERAGIECHLHAGHNDNWKNFNPGVRRLANSPGPDKPATAY